jgi:broad specificity phosphatase PhoE
MKRILPFLLLLALFVPVVSAESTIFFVRHAEKAQSGGKDPALSEAGVARAEMLAKILKDAAITAVYTTEFKRTQQTAVPLAKALGINLTTVPASDITALVSKLRDGKENALVVGHGNTIPELIKALEIATPINIGENDYDNLFIVTLDEKPHLVRLHYP